jgi:hypothetical protein
VPLFLEVSCALSAAERQLDYYFTDHFYCGVNSFSKTLWSCKASGTGNKR